MKDLLEIFEGNPRVLVPCLACGCRESEVAIVRQGFSFVRCRSCSSLFVNPRPTENSLSELYLRFPDFAAGRQTDLGHSPIDEAAEAKYRLKCLIKVARQGRLLDVGFGTGAFLRVARSRFDVVGLDLVVQHPPDLNGMPAFKGHLRAIPFVDGTFQVVTAFEVLEHLFEARGFLDEAYRVMTPDGILVIQTGDADSMLARLNPETWRYLLPPVHLNAFSRKALLALLGKAGFEHVKAWSFGRAPKRTPFVSRLSNPEAFRPLLNFAGRLGLIGQLHAFRKASHR